MRTLFLLFFIRLQGFLEISCYNVDSDWVNLTPRNAPPIPTREFLCEERDCDYFADDFSGSINESTLPCDDFYQHACGRWISHHDLGQGAILDRYSKIQEDILTKMNSLLTKPENVYDNIGLSKAKMFYAKCLDEANIEMEGTKPLIDMHESYGGWPLIRKPGDVRELIKFRLLHERLSNEKGIDTLFYIGVGLNQTNPQTRIITIDTPEINTDDLEFSSSLKQRRQSNVGNLYREYMTDVAIVLYGNEPIDEYTSEKLLDNVDKIIEFQEKLSKLVDDSFRHDSDDNDYRIMTIKELQMIWDEATVKSRTGDRYEINWFLTIRNRFAKVSPLPLITKKERVALISERYIRGLGRLLLHTDEEIIVNYIHWNGIHHLLKYTNAVMRGIRDHYIYLQFGVSGNDDRWRTCAKDFPLKEAIIEEMKPFIDSKVRDNDVRKMEYAIREEFRKAILNSTWLSEGEKDAAVQKIINIVDSIGYPYWIREVYDLYQYFNEIPFDNASSYFSNSVRMILFRRFRKLKKLRSPVITRENEWDEISPFDTTAMYIEQTNNIIIPAGVLNHPHIRFGYLPAARWAALGSIIGHEIGHSLDNEGRLWDANRRKQKWWSNETIQNYKTKEKCFIEKYNSYKIQPETGATFHVNGTNTLRENIADHQGILMAFRAFQNFRKTNPITFGIEGLTTRYTQEQLYFYSLAQSFCEKTTNKYLRNVYGEDDHPPWKVRINGALSDMKEFSAAFQCKNGDRMKKSRGKCQIWGN